MKCGERCKKGKENDVEHRVQVSEIKRKQREREWRIMGELETERAGLKCQETVCGK